MTTRHKGFCEPGWWTEERKATMWTPERRQRQREQARRLHAEGRLGGSEFGRMGAAARHGKVDAQNRLVQEAIAGAAREQADVILAKLDAMLHSDNQRLQLAAIKQMFAAERFVAKHPDPAAEFEAMTDEELELEMYSVLSELLGIDFTNRE